MTDTRVSSTACLPDDQSGACVRYSSGHAVHWIPALHSANAEWLPAHLSAIHDEHVTLQLGTATVRAWHHDAAHLGELRAQWGAAGGTAEWCPQFRLLRLRLGERTPLLSLLLDA